MLAHVLNHNFAGNRQADSCCIESSRFVIGLISFSVVALVCFVVLFDLVLLVDRAQMLTALVTKRIRAAVAAEMTVAVFASDGARDADRLFAALAVHCAVQTDVVEAV